VTKSPSKQRKGSSEEAAAKVLRGNLGFCFLDMSLINLCGVPSLWIDPREYATSSVKISLGEKTISYPLIKPF